MALDAIEAEFWIVLTTFPELRLAWQIVILVLNIIVSGNNL